jgi:FkbM family methyltransferase
MPRIESIRPFLGETVVKVVDVGANPIDGEAIYKQLLQAGAARVIGFEPDGEAFGKLQSARGPHEIYHQLAVGDGKEHAFHVCHAPGMSSMFEPNHELLKYFHGFSEWGRIERTVQLKTVRLDDVADAREVDFLKLDVQGYELEILRHASETLKAATIIHVECNFLPLYVGQPLFTDVDAFLRSRGFQFHRFSPLVSRVMKPMLLNKDIFAGLSQVLWADAVFIRDFTRFDELAAGKLLKLALVLHDVYGSYDVAFHALLAHDRQTGGQLAGDYQKFLARSPATQKPGSHTIRP